VGIKGFQKNNKMAVKLKTDKLKILAYESYCQHIAEGKCKESWYFEHTECECSWQTIEKYITELPSVLKPEKKELAEAKSLALWEKKGIDMIEGLRPVETALYQLFMRNKFKWDKKENQSVTFSAEKLQSLASFFSIFEKSNNT